MSGAVKDLKCPVCQEDLDVYDEFAVTRCNNFYHQDEVCLHQECRTAWMKKHDVKNLKKSNGYPCPGPGCNGRVDHTHITKHKRPKAPPQPQQSHPGPQCKVPLTPKQRQQQALQTQLAQQAAYNRQQAAAAAAARRAAILAEPEVPLALQVPVQKPAKATKDALPTGIPGAEAIVTPSKAKSKKAKRAKAAEQPSPTTEERAGSSRIASPGFGSSKVRSEASEDGYGSSHSDQTTAHSGCGSSWVTSLDRYNLLLAQMNAGSGEEEEEEEDDEEDKEGRIQKPVEGYEGNGRDEGLERILREIAEEEEGEAELRRMEAQQQQQEQRQEQEKRAAAAASAVLHEAPLPPAWQAPQQQQLPQSAVAPQQQQFHAAIAPQQHTWTPRGAAAQSPTAAPVAGWGGTAAPAVPSLGTPHTQAPPVYQGLATASLKGTAHHSAAFPASVAAYAQPSPGVVRSAPPVAAYAQQAPPPVDPVNMAATTHKRTALQQESMAEAEGGPVQEEGDLGELLALCLGDS
mmetsp:Transcript_29391/g.76231  ORF Transcript_29391/g.76231 Transcript_29391/m.76231 type:complete len:517 (-) Transcript_29391:663-2213(-)